MTEQELVYIQKIISEATPGPWGPYAANVPFYAVVTKPAPSLSKHDDDGSNHWRVEDAVFVAMAREKLPALVAEIKTLQIALRNISNETLVYNGVPEFEMIGDIARAALESS